MYSPALWGIVSHCGQTGRCAPPTWIIVVADSLGIARIVAYCRSTCSRSAGGVRAGGMGNSRSRCPIQLNMRRQT